MNEALQNKLVEVLESGKQGVLQAADMLKEQMPDLAEQILKWNFATSLMHFCVGITILIGAIIVAKRFKLLTSDKMKETEFGSLSIIAPMIVGLAVCFSSYTWIKILIAPKLFLIKCILTLVK